MRRFCRWLKDAFANGIPTLMIDEHNNFRRRQRQIGFKNKRLLLNVLQCKRERRKQLPRLMVVRLNNGQHQPFTL